MFKDYKWQHDYVRLAFDTGFCFERGKPENFDKNKISAVDIDQIIEERDIGTIENLIPTVSKFALDPEQAQILDTSFVKTFRLSQLSIQYLLFCKKYLDNTLIIIKGEVKKLKEENQELYLFVEDLKAHVSTLMKEIDEKPIFTCTQCNKKFSSEEFLTSHIKRRHSSPLKEAETDKLQMEIKDLKGRLNNAEKMIHKEQSEIDANTKETELRKIEDLQTRFEELRLQVQSELKILQTQHTFQEKYEKWFEKMALQGSASSTSFKVKERGGGDIMRRESTTQTDLEIDFQPINTFEEKNKENIPEISNTQKQMTELGESLEIKVNSSLQKIESQMQSFWNKLNEMERYRRKDSGNEVKAVQPKPQVRTKKILEKQFDLEFVEAEQTDDTPVDIDKSKKEEIKHSVFEETISEDLGVTRIDTVKIVAAQVKKDSYKIDDDTISSATNASETEATADSPRNEENAKPLPTPRKPTSSVDKNSTVSEIDDELLAHFRSEVEKIIIKRLQELGVSPEWKGLPSRSFQRALEIVNHQASLMKKNYANFDFISSQLEKNIDKNLRETKSRQKIVRKPEKVETKKVCTVEKTSPKVEIRNRKMYDTDSESDEKPLPVKENLKLKHFSAPYSAVIEELKAVTSKIESEKAEIKETEVKNDDQTKGVLKSYPSVASLTKKKVLFNLDTDHGDVSKDGDGGSTTSITSSIFDPTPRKEEKKKDRENIEDLSDFDFSDM